MRQLDLNGSFARHVVDRYKRGQSPALIAECFGQQRPITVMRILRAKGILRPEDYTETDLIKDFDEKLSSDVKMALLKYVAMIRRCRGRGIEIDKRYKPTLKGFGRFLVSVGS